MNEILLNVLSVVVTAVIIPLISFLGLKLTQWLNTKIKNEKGQAIVQKATEVVLNAVKCVFQTYVEALKKEGKFDANAQKQALIQAKNLALAQLSTDAKDYIVANYGDLTQWLTTQIEASINTLKNK